jgi:hypothetical protein
MSRPSLLEQPLKLPCGTTLKNRICKSAMTEGLATMDGVPTDLLCNIYDKWSDSGAGLLITGNVQIDPYHLERPGNVVSTSNISPWPSAAVPRIRTWLACPWKRRSLTRPRPRLADHRQASQRRNEGRTQKVCRGSYEEQYGCFCANQPCRAADKLGGEEYACQHKGT